MKSYKFNVFGSEMTVTVSARGNTATLLRNAERFASLRLEDGEVFSSKPELTDFELAAIELALARLRSGDAPTAPSRAIAVALGLPLADDHAPEQSDPSAAA